MDYYSELMCTGLVCWTISFYFFSALAWGKIFIFPNIYIAVNFFKYYIYTMSQIIKLISGENIVTLVDGCDLAFAISGLAIFGFIMLQAITCSHSFYDRVPYLVYLFLVLSWFFSFGIFTLYCYDFSLSFSLNGVSINTRVYLEFIVGMLEILNIISLGLSGRFFLNTPGVIIIALQTVGSLLWIAAFSQALAETGVGILVGELAKNFMAVFSIIGLIPLAHIWMESAPKNENDVSLLNRHQSLFRYHIN